MKNIFKRIGAIGLLGVALAGCSPEATDNSLPEGVGTNYLNARANKYDVEEIKKEGELEMRIIHVQPSQLSFTHDRGGGSHEFIYVVGEDTKDHSTRTFIYPTSRAIIPGRTAKIKYYVLPHGAMNVQEFVKKFVPNSVSIDHNAIVNFEIPADGIIQHNGVIYK